MLLPARVVYAGVVNTGVNITIIVNVLTLVLDGWGGRLRREVGFDICNDICLIVRSHFQLANCIQLVQWNPAHTLAAIADTFCGTPGRFSLSRSW